MLISWLSLAFGPYPRILIIRNTQQELFFTPFEMPANDDDANAKQPTNDRSMPLYR